MLVWRAHWQPIIAKRESKNGARNKDELTALHIRFFFVIVFLNVTLWYQQHSLLLVRLIQSTPIVDLLCFCAASVDLVWVYTTFASFVVVFVVVVARANIDLASKSKPSACS